MFETLILVPWTVLVLSMPTLSCRGGICNHTLWQARLYPPCRPYRHGNHGPSVPSTASDDRRHRTCRVPTALRASRQRLLLQSTWSEGNKPGLIVTSLPRVKRRLKHRVRQHPPFVGGGSRRRGGARLIAARTLSNGAYRAYRRVPRRERMEKYTFRIPPRGVLRR